MWFVMPEGCNGVAVQLQQFECEIRDDDGRGYFRAPDHFAPLILSIGGFAIAQPPEGAPEDLPKADPLRDGAIAQLSKETEGLKLELAGAVQDLVAARAQLKATELERNKLNDRVREQLREIEALKEQIEDGAKS